MIKYIIKAEGEDSIFQAILNHGDRESTEVEPFNTFEQLVKFVEDNKKTLKKPFKAYEWQEIDEKVTITRVYPERKNNKKNKLVKSSSRFYESLKKIK